MLRLRNRHRLNNAVWPLGLSKPWRSVESPRLIGQYGVFPLMYHVGEKVTRPSTECSLATSLRRSADLEKSLLER